MDTPESMVRAKPRRFGTGPRPALTVAAILSRDWPAQGTLILFALSAACLLGGWLFLPVTPDERESVVFATTFVALPMVAAVGAFCAGRVWRIHGVFRRGVVVPGRIESVGTNSEDVAHAVVVYAFAGREYRLTQVIGPVSGEIKPDDPAVEVVVDPTRPRVGFVASLYLD